ncbi:BLOC-2 complex member HPS5 homolog [Chironomus tepperi]|uniref:BLOC-2 complex member HPS5 homolog n=1 Tax=Chironomus tepperi TaxID=113505 RepID=UPI00391F01B3
MEIDPNIDQKYYLSINNITSKQPAVYKSIDISKDLIVYGTDKSTGALFIYKRSPYSFFKAISGSQSIKGPITHIKISNDQQSIAYANAFGDIAVHSLKSSALLSRTAFGKLEAPCSALYWHYSDNEIYCGDISGNLSIITLTYFIGRNLINIYVNNILNELEGVIEQIDGFNEFLLVSSSTKTILCNNEKEEFKQIGNRPRDGKFGACFVADYEALEAQQSKLTTIDQEVFEKMLIENIKIYSCRPGMRLWEADLNGNVLKTHQYKNANFTAQKIAIMGNHEIDSSPVLFNKIHQFQLALPLDNKFVFTWNSSGFYIIDPKESKVIFWNNEFDGAIANAKIIQNNTIYLYLKDGRLLELKFYKLQHYALFLCNSEKIMQACELIKNNIEFFARIIRNSRTISEMNQYRTFLKIRDYLIANDRNDILKSLSDIFDELTSTRIPNVVILSKNFFNKSVDKEDEYNNEKVDEIPQMLPITKQKEEDSLSITSAEIDRAVKQLYIIHQTSLVSHLNFRERLSKIFDRFKSSQIIRILDELEKLFMDEYNGVERRRIVCKMFLEYLQPEIIFEIDDEKTLNYISDALLQVQNHVNEVSRCKRCEFPLNCGTSGTGYEDIANILQQFYWSRGEYEKCYELCRSLPHLLKITGKFLTDEKKFDKMILYAINLGDLEILHKSLEHFNDITLFYQLLDEYIMAINHGKFKCLKCDEINDVKNVHRILTWDILFHSIEYYLSGSELIDLLMRYSQQIPNGSISRQFYMKLLLHAYD